MRPLRFWSLFFALSTSAIVLFPRIAGAEPKGQKHRPVAKPVGKTVIVKKTVIVEIGRPYRAEAKPKIHARPWRLCEGDSL